MTLRKSVLVSVLLIGEVINAPCEASHISNDRYSSYCAHEGKDAQFVIITTRPFTVDAEGGSITWNVNTSDKTHTIHFAQKSGNSGLVALKNDDYQWYNWDLKRGRVFWIHYGRMDFTPAIYQIPIEVEAVTTAELLTASVATATAWLSTADDKARWEQTRILEAESVYKPGKPLKEDDSIIWGEANEVGLRLGFSGVKSHQSFPVGRPLPLKHYLRNDGDATLKFSTGEIFGESLEGFLEDEQGNKFPHRKGYPWPLTLSRHRLEPGHFKEFTTGALLPLPAKKDGSAAADLPRMGAAMVVQPGNYTLHMSQVVGEYIGQPMNTYVGDPRSAPGLGEWTGRLNSALLPIAIVDPNRKPEAPNTKVSEISVKGRGLDDVANTTDKSTLSELYSLMQEKLAERPNREGLAVLEQMMKLGNGPLRNLSFRLLGEMEQPQDPFDYDGIFHTMVRVGIEDSDGPKLLGSEARLGGTKFFQRFHRLRDTWEQHRVQLAADRYLLGEEMSGENGKIQWSENAGGLSIGVSGLQVGLPIGKSIPLEVFIRNDGDAPVKFSWPDDGNPQLQIFLTDSDNMKHAARYRYSGGFEYYDHANLEPGFGMKVVAVELENYATAGEIDSAGHKEGHSNNPRFAVPEGSYSAEVHYRIGYPKYENFPKVPIGDEKLEWTGVLISDPVRIQVKED
jgi:hypothetical protein